MKDVKNWVIGTIASVGTALVLTFIMWMIGAFSDGQSAITDAHIRSIVKAEMDEAGIVPEAKITAMEGDIEDNADDIDGIEDRWNALVDALAAQRVE